MKIQKVLKKSADILKNIFFKVYNNKPLSITSAFLIGVLVGYFIGDFVGYNKKVNFINNPSTDIRELTPFEQFQRLKNSQGGSNNKTEKTRPETKIPRPEDIKNIKNKQNPAIKETVNNQINSEEIEVDVDVIDLDQELITHNYDKIGKCHRKMSSLDLKMLALNTTKKKLYWTKHPLRLEKTLLSQLWVKTGPEKVLFLNYY